MAEWLTQRNREEKHDVLDARKSYNVICLDLVLILGYLENVSWFFSEISQICVLWIPLITCFPSNVSVSLCHSYWLPMYEKHVLLSFQRNSSDQSSSDWMNQYFSLCYLIYSIIQHIADHIFFFVHVLFEILDTYFVIVHLKYSILPYFY